MNNKKWKKVSFATVALLALSLIAGCASPPLRCHITAETYQFKEGQLVIDPPPGTYIFEITGESGPFTVNIPATTIQVEYDNRGAMKGFIVDVYEELTYENSKNTYKITGKITMDTSTNTVSYDIKVAGGIFGETPQTCKK